MTQAEKDNGSVVTEIPRPRRLGGGKLVIEYRRLDEIEHLPRNAKGHDVGAIVLAMREFGVIDPVGVNDRTGHDIDGNGRLLALRSMMAENAVKAPGGVLRDRDGMWLVPVVTGINLSEKDEERASLALNHTATLGGYDEADLSEILSDLAATGDLLGTSYDIDDVDALLRNLGRPRAGRAMVGDGPSVTTPVMPPPLEISTDETLPALEAAAELEAIAESALPAEAIGWPLVSLRMPPELYQEFRLGVMLLQQARGYGYFYQALIAMIREVRARLSITEAGYEQRHVGSDAEPGRPRE